MWRLLDSNKIVGTKCRVDSYKNHLKNLEQVKSELKIERPWTPSFSLSKMQNKYRKFVSQRISKENQNLLSRMMKIEAEPMRKTINYIPLTIPSNKQTFLELRARERKASTDEIRKENEKILSKLTNANSDYDKRTLSLEWKENKKYRDNIIRKEHIADYELLAKQDLENDYKSVLSRPRTAFAPASKESPSF